MSKKDFNKKVIRQSIIELREAGMSNQDIYNELLQKYYGKEDIAVLITKTIKNDIKEKYKVYNNILIGLLLLSVGFNFIAIIFMCFNFDAMWPVIMIVIFAILIKIIFVNEMVKYNADIYKICGWLGIFGVIFSLIKSNLSWLSATNILFTGITVFLCFYLRNKMFPDYNPNNLRKDKNGNYILN